MVKIEKFFAVEVETFGRGMQKLFEGMAEVFSSIGMEEPERLQAEKRKWRPAEDAGNGNTAEGADADDKSAGTHTDATAVGDTETPAAEPPAGLTEPVTQKKGRKKTKEPADPEPSTTEHDFPVDDDPPFDVDDEASPGTPEGATAPKSGKQEKASITADDIIKIIARKIKQNRSNNQRIGQLLKTYGVEKISNLPAAKYEAFVTDLAAL